MKQGFPGLSFRQTKARLPWRLLSAALALLLLLMPFFNASRAEESAKEAPYSRIDEYVEHEMRAGLIPGLSIAIVQGDQVLYQKGYGKASPSGASVTAQTPFMLGSVSKPLTALAVRQLVNAGKLAYDKKVTTYLPWFRTKDKAASDRITIRMLLEHTSGFSTASGGGAYRGHIYSMQELVEQLKNVELDRPVGTNMEYSNINYLVLGLVVQQVSGVSYESYIEQNIFVPLQMRHSYTSEQAALNDGLASGHRITFGIPLATHIPYPNGNVAHGFLISSAEDMAHYMICCLNNGYYNGVSVVPNNELSPAADPLAPFALADAYYTAYWEISRTPAGFYGHSGATVNYTSTYAVSQQTRYGVVVLANVAGEFYTPAVSPDTICAGIQTILSGGTPHLTERNGLTAGTWISFGTLAFALLVVTLRIAFFRRFRQAMESGGKRRSRAVASMILVDFLLPVALNLALWYMMGASLFYALIAIPEQAIPLGILCIGLIGTGLCKLVLLAGRKARLNPKDIRI